MVWIGFAFFFTLSFSIICWIFVSIKSRNFGNKALFILRFPACFIAAFASYKIVNSPYKVTIKEKEILQYYAYGKVSRIAENQFSECLVKLYELDSNIYLIYNGKKTRIQVTEGHERDKIISKLKSIGIEISTT